MYFFGGGENRKDAVLADPQCGRMYRERAPAAPQLCLKSQFFAMRSRSLQPAARNTEGEETRGHGGIEGALRDFHSHFIMLECSECLNERMKEGLACNP